LPHAKRQVGQKVLIGDNISSHIQPEIIYTCEQNNIDFVCLPKNSTHLTQRFFRPLKQAWRHFLNKWKNQNTGLKAILKSSFPTLVRKTLNTMERFNGGGSITRDLQSSFKATGIFALNKQHIMEKLPQQDNSVIIKDKVTDYLKSRLFIYIISSFRVSCFID